MSELEKQARTAENIVNTLFRLSEEGKLTEEQYLEIIDTLERIKKMSEKVIKNFENPLKEALELSSEVEVGGRVYSYKISTPFVFDAKKAKDKLYELNYSIEDFMSYQQRRSLVWEVKK